MIMPDANLLLYAYHTRAAQHEASKRWLETALSGSELVRFAWPTLWAFLRIATNPNVFEHPMSAAEASDAVSAWLERPGCGTLDPGDRHWSLLQQLLKEAQCTGPLVADAVIAALAIEHGATLYTTDRDFSRFPGLAWTNPLSDDSGQGAIRS
jgi:toxin-antitoxin system PIN domain toxin